MHYFCIKHHKTLWLTVGSLATSETRIRQGPEGNNSAEAKVKARSRSTLKTSLVSVFCPRPLHCLSSHPAPPPKARTLLLLDQEVDPQASKASFVTQFPANLCLNFDPFIVKEKPIWEKDHPAYTKGANMGAQRRTSSSLVHRTLGLRG